MKLYMERVMADDPQAAHDPDRALALVFDRYGKELDRLRRYETTISRALAKTYQELRDLARGRAEFDSQNAADNTEPAPAESSPEFVSQNAFIVSEPTMSATAASKAAPAAGVSHSAAL